MAGLHVSDIGVPVRQTEQALSTRPSGILHTDGGAAGLAHRRVLPLHSSVSGVPHSWPLHCRGGLLPLGTGLCLFCAF